MRILLLFMLIGLEQKQKKKRCKQCIKTVCVFTRPGYRLILCIHWKSCFMEIYTRAFVCLHYSLSMRTKTKQNRIIAEKKEDITPEYVNCTLYLIQREFE